MSKKAKKPKKAQPTEEKAAEKELLNYEPTPVEPAEANSLQFRYSLRYEGEERAREIYITVPNEPGATWEKSKTHAFRYYDALRRAEEWVEKEGVVDDLIEGDRANSWQHARAINKYAAGIITNNYLRVYMARALDDEAEAEYLQELSDALEVKDADDLVDRLFRAAEVVADTVAGQWAELESGPGSLPETAREYYSSHAANLAAAAILRAEEEREENSETDWAEAFHRHLDEVTEERAHLLALEHGNSIARSTLEEHQPVSMPLEKLRASLGLDLLLQSALEGKAGQASDTAKPAEAPAPTLELDLDRAGLGILSMQPAQTIDRAARSPSGWLIAPDRLPRFNDPRSPLFVEYQRDGATAEALAEYVSGLNPRTADVWRLITARSLEAWQQGQDSPPSIWLDVREIAAAMGYKKHHRGGYKPEHLEEVARAIRDLDAFRLTLPLGTEIYQPAKAGSKRRAPEKLTAVRIHKVLEISTQDEVRNLFGDSWPLRYELKPGAWIKNFPRTYAPLFRALVELPAKAGASTWAKAIGTELAYQYRQNAKNSNGVEKLKVRTMLERAVLLQEASASRNKGRMRTYFEEALDTLTAENVCAGWTYEPEDSDRLEAVAGVRGWFDVWLECRVLITTPDSITSELQATSDTAKKAQREQRRRRLRDTR